MPKRSSKPELDPNLIALRTLQEATGVVDLVHTSAPPPADRKNPAAVSLGRLGGLKGGKARAKALAAKRRKAIAKNAAKARWIDRPKATGSLSRNSR